MTSVGKKGNPDQESQFDFEQILPVPQALHDTVKGSFSDPDEQAAHAQQMASNVIKYGYQTWYEFCNNVWGTKWNAYDISVSDDSIRFDTAWSTPQPVIAKLSELLPDLKIRVDYADEDISANCGYYIYEGGELSEDVNMDYRTVGDQEAKEFACNVKYGDPHAYLEWEENEDDE